MIANKEGCAKLQLVKCTSSVIMKIIRVALKTSTKLDKLGRILTNLDPFDCKTVSIIKHVGILTAVTIYFFKIV